MSGSLVPPQLLLPLVPPQLPLPLVEPAEQLSSEEIQRYSRHLLIPRIGAIGQRRLKNARVLVIGAGGLGSPVLLYLAAAGIGTLGIVDDDTVDPSNLQRQIIHGVQDIGRPKLDSARDAIAALNPLVEVRLHPVRLAAANALELFGDYDLIVDGSDNFATRYLVNDAAAILGKPYVWGSVLRFDGQVSVFWQHHGPTYRDLYPEAPPAGSVPSCGEGGVFGMLCGAVGAAMVAEVVKLVTGVGRTLLGRLAIIDALDASWRELRIPLDPDRAPISALVDYDAMCGVQSGQAASLPVADLSSISVHDLAASLRARDRGDTAFDLIDVREPGEHEIVRIPGSTLIPQGELLSGDAAAALSAERHIILYCKSGARSSAVAVELQRRGFTRVTQVSGGVLAWIAEIDSSLPTY
ncbi:adenylyltransferase/sulfurtransferase [Frigoribacterium sp. CG_9.8]|nr:adenylyltransferase/sulfurtransferase [Frigoribacterium sp. CG_9.8]